MSRKNGKDWLTVKETSYITGKSIDAIRMLLHRKKLSNVKKVNNGGQRSYWLIHKDTVELLHNSNVTDTLQEIEHDNSITNNSIPLEFYDKKQQEWLQERDNLKQGLVMYQYKIEDYERKLKLLPAPIEIIAEELKINKEELKQMREQTARMQELEGKIRDLETELQVEKKRPWWKRFWKK